MKTCCRRDSYYRRQAFNRINKLPWRSVFKTSRFSILQYSLFRTKSLKSCSVYPENLLQYLSQYIDNKVKILSLFSIPPCPLPYQTFQRLILKCWSNNVRKCNNSIRKSSSSKPTQKRQQKQVILNRQLRKQKKLLRLEHRRKIYKNSRRRY